MTAMFVVWSSSAHLTSGERSRITPEPPPYNTLVLKRIELSQKKACYSSTRKFNGSDSYVSPTGASSVSLALRSPAWLSNQREASSHDARETEGSITSGRDENKARSGMLVGVC